MAWDQQRVQSTDGARCQMRLYQPLLVAGLKQDDATWEKFEAAVMHAC